MDPRSVAFAGLLALALGSPASAQEEGPPPTGGEPAPPGKEEPKEPPAKPAPGPETMVQAFRRYEALRKAPVSDPGGLVRRAERFRRLAAAAVAIHAAEPVQGEDLYRIAEMCMEAERFEDATSFATKYLESAGKDLPPSAGYAHAIRVRALARLGRIADAESAMDAYRKALPGGEGLSPVLKSLGDALVVAERPADALVRYRESFDRMQRPLRAWAPATVQALSETLTALGKSTEAAETVKKVVEETKDPVMLARMEAILHRAEMAGRPFVPPAVDQWLGGDAPAAEALRGKVVVWHLFAWWMQARTADLADWMKRREELAARGIVVVPVTRTSGWDPAANGFREGRKTEEECADIGGVVKACGTGGPVGVAYGDFAFKALLVRGLPMEVVLDRGGKVRFASAGGEASHLLARLAAERAASEPPPGEAAKEPSGEPAPAPAPAGEKKE